GWLSAQRETTDDDVVDGLGSALALMGTLVFIVSSGIYIRGEALTLLVLGWAAAMVAMGRGRDRLAYVPQATVVVAILAVKWLIWDGLSPLLTTWDQPGTIPPVVNAVALTGALLVGMATWLGRRLARGGRMAALVAAGVI